MCGKIAVTTIPTTLGRTFKSGLFKRKYSGKVTRDGIGNTVLTNVSGLM